MRSVTQQLPYYPGVGLKSTGYRFIMSELHTTISRIVLTLLFLTAGLSAQRYTGHDHAVFHRQPQAPPTAAKHQSSSPGSAAAGHQKTATPAPSSPQSGARAANAQGKLDVDVNHNSTPVKADPSLQNAPRL
jgi:hypothetical protein